MNRTDNKTVNVLDARQQKYGGIDTPAGAATDIKGFSQVREQVLGLKLDKMSDSVTGQTVVDPRGFLTDLNSLKNPSQAEIGDIKKARLLLKSMITTNPGHGLGWIAAARLEAQVP
jgi:pre-mRNA-processing factor 6